MRLFDNPNSTAGKMTVSILIAGFAIFVVLFSFDLQHEYVVQKVQAQQDYATTTVFVLNTPPAWTVNAQEEDPGSSTSTPTNATSSLSWVAVGTDSNAQDYFLIICSTAVAPTANNDAPPTCDGGASNTWAVSPTTTSGTVATATYTTLISDAERNEWWASICDAPATGLARCNTEIQQGDKANDTATSSPFHVNHRPDFTIASNTGPVDPGATISFTSTSSDTDTLGSDTVQLFVCKTQDFDYTNILCPGGAWATSSLAAQDVSTSTEISVPTQDGEYNAYFYVVDNHGFAALEEPDEPGSAQATDSPFTVNNVAPTVATSTISLNYGDPMILSNPGGETTGFTLTFTVRDNNSCVANASTTNEHNSAVVGIYRSGVTSASCDEGTEFNTNSCYHTATGTEWWATSIAATSTDPCDGPTDLTTDYEFTFPLWYNADPTDGVDLTDSTWFDENWIASVIVDDDDFATSTVATSTGVELNGLLAFDVTQTSISFGSLEPGNTTTPVLGSTTTVQSLGNLGIDQNLLGEDMCTYYQTFSDCWTHSSTSTIGAEQQRFSTTTDTYADATTNGYVVSSTTPFELEVNVPKTTATSSPAEGDVTWGIAIPASIALSGTYFGQNTFEVVRGEAQDW